MPGCRHCGVPLAEPALWRDLTLKQRLITAAIGVALFVVIMFFFSTLVYNIVLAALSVLAVYELLLATKYVQNKLLTVCSLAFAAAVPFLRLPEIRKYSILFVFAFVMVLFGILLAGHKTVRIEQIGLVFFVTLFFPFAVTSLIYIRDEFGAERGLLYNVLVFACAWGADAGAYFIGRLFGKKKLAPEISPNKTVAGFWGGFLGAFVLMGIIIAGFYFWNQMDPAFSIHWGAFIIAGVVGTLLSVFGDLSASIIKRQCAIKDFGTIFPGHGGIVDRFDSIFFVAPFFYMLLHFWPI